jgi:predicted RNA binding protein YcfA (HicA-like mRNA interferase family)
MKSISGKKLAKILEKKGWILVKMRGSHFKYENGKDSVIVPIHSNLGLSENNDDFGCSKHFQRCRSLPLFLIET